MFTRFLDWLMDDVWNQLTLGSIVLAIFFMGYIVGNTFAHIEQQKSMVQELVQKYEDRIAKYK